MNTGDLITVYIATTSDPAASYTKIASMTGALKSSQLNHLPRTTVNIVMTPESGAVTEAALGIPSNYGIRENVQLYP
jgi:flagellin FlaB